MYVVFGLHGIHTVLYIFFTFPPNPEVSIGVSKILGLSLSYKFSLSPTFLISLGNSTEGISPPCSKPVKFSPSSNCGLHVKLFKILPVAINTLILYVPSAKSRVVKFFALEYAVSSPPLTVVYEPSFSFCCRRIASELVAVPNDHVPSIFLDKVYFPAEILIGLL